MFTWSLNKTMYGTRDASNAWQKLWAEHLRSNGFEWYKKSSVVQIRPCEWILPRLKNCCKRSSIRERSARQVQENTGQRTGSVALICESDQQRVDGNGGGSEACSQLPEDLGLIQSNMVKLSAIEAEAIETSAILEGEQATTFRSGTMQCAYQAQDRLNISEAIKCLA